jgi:hypothetical protein
MAQIIDMTEVKVSDTVTQYAYGPMVLEADAGDGEIGHRPVLSVSLIEDPEDGVAVQLGGVEGAGYYQLKSAKDFKVDASVPKITFEFQGTIYTIRKFQDSDGTWASMTGAAVPAEVLEEIFMDETTADFAPDLAKNYDPEELYTLTNDSGDVVYFVYSGANQTFIRKDGEWASLDDPNGDLLDDLYIEYVSPAFVDYFDKNEKKGLTVSDLTDYETDEVVTASAATGFKFASVINKKD